MSATTDSKEFGFSTPTLANTTIWIGQAHKTLLNGENLSPD